MIKQHFSFKEIFLFGWAKTKQHAWFLFLTLIIMGVITNSVKHVPLLDGLVGVFVSLAIFSVALPITRDHHFTFADLFYPVLSRAKTLKYVALTLLYALPGLFAANIFAVALLEQKQWFGVVGIVVAAIAIYTSVRFMFYPFVVIEHENAKLSELIRMTSNMTKGKMVPVFVFSLAIVALNFVGALLFGVGLLLTFPVSLFATAHLYNRFK